MRRGRPSNADLKPHVGGASTSLAVTRWYLSRARARGPGWKRTQGFACGGAQRATNLGGASMSARDDSEAIARYAEALELIAAQLERVMPALRSARDAASDPAPRRTQLAGFDGSFGGLVTEAEGDG